MGKWFYINMLILVASLVYMYLHFGNYYQPPLHVYVLASLFWIMFYGLGYYIFVYSMKPQRKNDQTTAAERRSSVSAASPTERPKVLLKKERPKVELKKKKQ